MTTHVIRDCHLTRVLAFGSCWGFKLDYFCEGRPGGLVEECCNLSKEIGPQEVETNKVEPLFVSTFLATFFYVAQNARNDFIFEGERCLEQWIKFLEVSLRDFLQVDNTDDCSMSGMEKVLETPKLWEKLEQGWTKVNIDAGFKNAVSASAMVVHDHDGNVLWFNSKHGVCKSPLHAEAQALEWAASYAANCGWERVVWNKDAANLVRDINLVEDPSNWDTRYSIMSFRKHCFGRDWKQLCASRPTNIVADAVANLSLKIGSVFCFDETSIKEAPSCIFSSVIACQ